jgi:hypothetical protein
MRRRVQLERSKRFSCRKAGVRAADGSGQRLRLVEYVNGTSAMEMARAARASVAPRKIEANAEGLGDPGAIAARHRSAEGRRDSAVEVTVVKLDARRINVCLDQEQGASPLDPGSSSASHF